jgi:hypothetical protein
MFPVNPRAKEVMSLEGQSVSPRQRKVIYKTIPLINRL